MDDIAQPGTVLGPERFESQTSNTPLLSSEAAETGNKAGRINLKMELGLLPLLLLYLANGFDTGNVGNAQTQG
ncbi:hypothetical protein MFIFM68171_05542 [Madurella fahalii]|uniref:Uncharacterized protein n=1 Tax=Madurella fahalii TaxID=1157608 RepID=A0ABQ0GC37_9PEZI